VLTWRVRTYVKSCLVQTMRVDSEDLVSLHELSSQPSKVSHVDNVSWLVESCIHGQNSTLRVVLYKQRELTMRTLLV